jgi:inorganic pyrophosphatase
MNENSSNAEIRETVGFWRHLDELLAICKLVIDRPAGSTHPRYPDFVYPLDYGYLEATTAADGGGIDVWAGSLPGRKLVGVICTVDLVKRDAEIKLLVGCTRQQMQQALAKHNHGMQSGVLIERPPEPAYEAVVGDKEEGSTDYTSTTSSVRKPVLRSSE